MDQGLSRPRAAERRADPCWLWEGIELLGCCGAEKKGVKNGVLYTVEELTEEGV